MGKYILKRIGRSLLSLIAVMILTIILIYTLMNRELLVSKQPEINQKINNDRLTFKYQVWEEYGYLETYDYRSFCAIKYDYGTDEFKRCENIDEVFTTKEKYCKITNFDDDDDYYDDCLDAPRNYLIDKDIPEIAEFIKEMKKEGYKIVRSNPIPEDMIASNNDGASEDYNYLMQPKGANDDETPEYVAPLTLARGGQGILFAYKSRSTFARLWDFFSNVFYFDGKHYYQKLNKENKKIDEENYTAIELDPYIRFEKSHEGTYALRCNGCKHKYLLYFDKKFPFIHQNWIEFNLGNSKKYSKDVIEVMTDTQGEPIVSDVVYPDGSVDPNAHKINMFTCTISSSGNPTPSDFKKYKGYYTECKEVLNGHSMMTYSFVIGIIATIIAYILGVPIGILMARNKGKLIDKIGICYIVFMMAVPSLAYIYMFRRIGSNLGLPIMFGGSSWTIYILPVVSLALPSVGGLMSWVRRYMIDQMNSDYVKFAKAKGLSEMEIFNRHILKNAIIPIIHNIPGSFLGSLTGALITERVFSVPGVGKLFTDAITDTDNNAILGLTFFYAILSIASLILGDVMMAMVDPRISFSEKGGRK